MMLVGGETVRSGSAEAEGEHGTSRDEGEGERESGCERSRRWTYIKACHCRASAGAWTQVYSGANRLPTSKHSTTAPFWYDGARVARNEW
jgi:hypothetical protein